MHAALGDVHRLQVVDLLATTDLSSSELVAALSIPSNLLAHHLSTLEDAGLLTRRRSEGDGRRTYLSLTRAGAAPVTNPTRHTSAPPGAPGGVRVHRQHRPLPPRRSPVAEGQPGGGHLRRHPSRRPHPLWRTRRRWTPPPRAARRPTRLLADTVEDSDLLVTVCDRAHEALGGHARIHWSIPDPVPVGTRAAFDAAHDALAERIEALAPAIW